MVRNTKRAIETPENVRKDVARYTVPQVALMVGAASSTPVDSTTYYFGCHYSKTLLTTADTTRVYIPITGRIKSANLVWRASPAGTSENVSAYVRLNNTTDTLIQTVGDANNTKVFSNSSMSVAVTAGDYIEIKLVCPGWATNPDAVTIGGNIYVVGK